MSDLREPWLVAAWPGMGAVGYLAAEHLARRPGSEALAAVPPGDYFHPSAIELREGILLPPRAPRTIISGWRNPGSGRDLVTMLGEQQPSASSWRYALAALASAREFGVTRAFTFAAMATPSHPRSPARVFACATDSAVLSELRSLEVEVIPSGEIGGMNGVFLAAAAEQGIPGACLLGEMPFFAPGVSNPKAAAAVLRVFARLADIELDLAELDRAGAVIEAQLSEHYDRMEQAARAIQEAAARRAGAETPGAETPAEAEEGGIPEDWPKPPGDDLSPEDSARVEALFAEVQRDRSKALELKAELDRLGVFRSYENRFLDLFRRGE